MFNSILHHEANTYIDARAEDENAQENEAVVDNGLK